MGGRALVEIEQFVGLGATELAPTTEERFQARPLVGVRGHIGVQVHAATVCRVSEPMIAPIGVTEDDLLTREAVPLVLPPPSVGLPLERALSYISEDELVEITPQSIRLRKRWLDPNERKKAGRKKEAA